MKFVLIIFMMSGQGATSEQVPMKNAELCEIAAEAVKDWTKRSGSRFATATCVKVK